MDIVSVLEAKGIVGVAHVTQVIVLKKLHRNNYNKREIHVSQKRYMVLQSLLVQEDLIWCLDVCEVGGKKGFTEEIILELSLPERKIDTTIMKERRQHTATRNVIAKAGMNMWITI